MKPSSVGNLFRGLTRVIGGGLRQPLIYNAQGLASAAGHGADCLADNVDNGCWSGDARRVIDSERPYLGLHALRHIKLRLRNDHSIFLGYHEPTRAVRPKSAPCRDTRA